MEINHLDLFSGIGGFHLGFEKAGYKVNAFFSEVDQHAIAVYKHQFPNSTYVGSVTDVRGADLHRIDLITFGSPCQDFSLAGKRKGMSGDRSSLVSEAIRLIDECRPRVFVWENVKGTFSSNNGEDFAAIIQAFADLGGYTLEWQLLNTAWFLPQNRERIYLVGYLGRPRHYSGSVFPINETSGEDIIMEGARAAVSKTLTARGQADLHSGLQLVEVQYTSATDIRGNETIATIRQGRRIRRLTPIECERLQGFPDNHTKYGMIDGNVTEMANTHRYKQCGNAVTVDVVEAVAKRIKINHLL
jgi:DNA (cytosine-5)-methyltransferase 1